MEIIIGVAVIVIAAAIIGGGAWLLRERLGWFKSTDEKETRERLARLEKRVDEQQPPMIVVLADIRDLPSRQQEVIAAGAAEISRPTPIRERAVHIGKEDLAKATGPRMSLAAPTAVYLGDTFTVMVKADPAPDIEISGFASEVLFPEGMEWLQRPSCTDEVRVERQDGGPPAFCLSFTTKFQGAGHAVLSEFAAPPVAALDVTPGSTTTLIEMDVICNKVGIHNVTLTAIPNSPFGAFYADLNANALEVKTVDDDGRPVAGTITIECIERPPPAALG